MYCVGALRVSSNDTLGDCYHAARRLHHMNAYVPNILIIACWTIPNTGTADSHELTLGI